MKFARRTKRFPMINFLIHRLVFLFVLNHLQLINIEIRRPVIGSNEESTFYWNHGRLLASQLTSIFNFIAMRRRSGDLGDVLKFQGHLHQHHQHNRLNLVKLSTTSSSAG